MILKIFNQPLQKSADYIVSYLLDEEKHEGYKPELIQGSPDLTRTITNAITRKQKYIAGCIRLRNDENLSDAQQFELINRFERTFAPFDDPGRINFLWVRHKDKGGIELNFVFPRTDLKTGKAYNIHPPGKQTKLLVNCFIALENHRHGFRQIDGSTLNDSAKKIEIVKNIAKQRALYIAQKIDKSIKSPRLKFNQEDKNGKQKQQLHSRGIRLNDWQIIWASLNLLETNFKALSQRVILLEQISLVRQETETYQKQVIQQMITNSALIKSQVQILISREKQRRQEQQGTSSGSMGKMKLKR